MDRILKGRGESKKSMKYGRGCVVALLSCLLVLNNTIFVSAEENWPTIGQIQADSYIVMDQNTGNVLLEKNSAKRINPASLTKILTAAVAIEHLQMDDIITVSRAAASLPDSESTIDLTEGEKLTFKELLYGMLVASGNDAAKAIAEKAGGSEAAFIAMMNQKSKDIGAKNSSWSNPQGVTADTHYTTSYDLAIITRYALQNNILKTVVDTKVYSMAPTNKHPYSGWNILENTNKLLRYQEEYFASDLIYSISGVKTGTTTAAGSNLIVTAHTKNGLELICVLNGVRGDQAKNLWAYTRTLLEEAARITEGVQKVLNENDPVVPVNDTNPWTPAESFSFYIKNDTALEVSITLENNELVVKNKDNKILFSTKASDSSVNSNITSSDSSIGTSSEQSNSNGSAEPVTEGKDLLYIILLSGAVILLGGYALYLLFNKKNRKRSPKAKRTNKSKKY